MRYIVRFLPLAKEDKKQIRNYLRQFYPGTPIRFSADLKKNIAAIKDNPYMWPEYPEYPVYRRMFCGNYLVFYKVNDDDKIVEIHRILRASWDIPKHL
jgi:plasmid stabilization system protein ParE